MRCAVRLALAIILTLPVCVSVAKDKEQAATESRSRQVLGAPDLSREFAMEQLNPWGRANQFRTKAARQNEFYFQQKFQPKGYSAKEFKSKGWWAGDFKFSTKDASTKGKYEIPNTANAVATQTKDVKDAREATKTMTTRDLPDGSRKYLGQESRRMEKPLDPTNLPKITNSMRELKSIDDVKELLNKNR
jgi:hypothetical protein